MPFGNLFPNLPLPFMTTLFAIVGFLGALLLIYSVYLEPERRKDAIILVGAAALFVYALFVENLIFMLATGGMFLVALGEFIQILRGKHRHVKSDSLR